MSVGDKKTVGDSESRRHLDKTGNNTVIFPGIIICRVPPLKNIKMLKLLNLSSFDQNSDFVSQNFSYFRD